MCFPLPVDNNHWHFSLDWNATKDYEEVRKNRERPEGGESWSGSSAGVVEIQVRVASAKSPGRLFQLILCHSHNAVEEQVVGRGYDTLTKTRCGAELTTWWGRKYPLTTPPPNRKQASIASETDNKRFRGMRLNTCKKKNWQTERPSQRKAADTNVPGEGEKNEGTS